MDARDAEIFARAFHRAVMVLQLRLSKAHLAELTQSYFKILEPFPLDQVLEGLKKACRSAKRFPRPVELVALLTTQAASLHAPPASVTHRQMSLSEIEAGKDAAGCHFQREPCSCEACVAAHISHQPIRFVPTLMDDGDSEERAYNPQTKRLEVVGHWAHGEELKRWYASRREFFDRLKQAPKGLAPVLAFVGREPGEEG